MHDELKRMHTATSLHGKVAVVTGASSGIGQAVAHKLADRGVRLVLHGRRKERMQEIASCHPDVEFIAGDICQPDTPQRLLELALDRFGRVDIALSNAGVNHTATIAEIDIDKVCAMARTNVEAIFRFSYVMLKHFVPRNRGHLVNTTSVMGSKVRETAGAYAGTKHAIEAEYQAEAYPGYMVPLIRLPHADALSGDRACALGMFGMVPHWADIKLARQTYNARTDFKDQTLPLPIRERWSIEDLRGKQPQ